MSRLWIKPRKVNKNPEEVRKAEEEQKRRNTPEAEGGYHWTSTRRKKTIYEGIEAIRAAGEVQEEEIKNEAREEGDHWEIPKRRNKIKPRKIFDNKKSKTHTKNQEMKKELNR